MAPPFLPCITALNLAIATIADAGSPGNWNMGKANALFTKLKISKSLKWIDVFGLPNGGIGCSVR